MRLKSINIDERSSVYSIEQRERLRNISENINRIGDIFDKIVDLEMFVIDNVEKTMNDFMLVKMNKERIVSEEGEAKYINYFKNAAEKLTKDLDQTSKNWDERMKSNKLNSYTVENIKAAIDNYKKLHAFISPVLVPDSELHIEGFEALKNIIEEFTHFRVYKVLTSTDVSEKLNILIDLKSKIDGTKATTKKISIEDL